MRKSQLIKFLEKLKGDPEVGLNVLTDCNSEFWGLSMSKVKLTDNGQLVSLGQLRQRKALPTRVLLKLQTPGVDSYDADLPGAVERFKARYSIDPEQLAELSDDDFKELIMQTIRRDLIELVRLNDDFLSLYQDPKLTQRFKVN